MKRLFLIVAVLFCMAGIVNADNTFTINEIMVGDYNNEIEFTVNNSYTNIVEFVVGNNNAQNAYRLYEGTAPALLEGYLLEKMDNHWMAISWRGEEKTILREIRWMDDLPEFIDYQYAFLFTSWQEDGYGGYFGDYLELGETSGYMGHTEMVGSPFAALRARAGLIVGETTHSAVPIPGAVWLLGSGLLCMMAIRKRK